MSTPGRLSLKMSMAAKFRYVTLPGESILVYQLSSGIRFQASPVSAVTAESGQCAAQVFSWNDSCMEKQGVCMRNDYGIVVCDGAQLIRSGRQPRCHRSFNRFLGMTRTSQSLASPPLANPLHRSRFSHLKLRHSSVKHRASQTAGQVFPRQSFWTGAHLCDYRFSELSGHDQGYMPDETHCAASAT